MFFTIVPSLIPQAMHLTMRRLHPRGAANRGICVDAQGAMLGPDCVLVGRTVRGFCGIERDHAAALQECAVVESRDRDLLFRQSRRIAEALGRGEIALAQIYGLHIPVVDLDDRRLTRIARISFARGYDPDEPRIPKGDPHGGEWTTGGTADATTGNSANGGTQAGDGGEDGSGSGESGSVPAPGEDAFASDGPTATTGAQGDGGSESPAEPPVKFEWPQTPEASPPSSPASEPAPDDTASTAGGTDGRIFPAPGESIPAPGQTSATSGNQGDGGSGSPAEPPIRFEWPQSPEVSLPSSPPASEPTPAGTPSTAGSTDVGDDSQPGGASTEDAGDGNASAASPDATLPPQPDIPSAEPPTTQQRNAVLRAVATWLGRALTVLGPLFQLDPRIRMVFTAIDAAVWIADYLPKLLSYLDGPKTLADLQTAATRPAPSGYEIHHIVEAQKDSDNEESNAKRFPDRIDSRENLVRVPYWKHVEISSWYSRSNRQYGGLSPRAYLRGKSWQEQYDVGLEILRRIGVLK